jgi:threonine/homoserine/homoserine lactone efflux protein
MLTYTILGATYAFAAAAQPGQFQAYLISQTLSHGWRRAIPITLAPILSDLPIIALVLFVLTRVPPLFLSGLQVVGGLFLIYLAGSALRAARTPQPPSAASAAPAHRTVLKAALVNLLNPNPYLAWALILGPTLIGAWRQAPGYGIAFLAAFYVTMVLATAVIVLVFSAARSLGPRIARILVGVSAAALGAFGVYQLWSGSTALLQRLS